MFDFEAMVDAADEAGMRYAECESSIITTSYSYALNIADMWFVHDMLDGETWEAAVERSEYPFSEAQMDEIYQAFARSYVGRMRKRSEQIRRKQGNWSTMMPIDRYTVQAIGHFN